MRTPAVQRLSESRSDLSVRGLRVGYGQHLVLDGLDLTIGPGFTALIGPNACGKSTLLGTMARLLRPTGGTVVLSGSDIHSLPTREVARRLGILPQTPVAPDGITVAELVRRGRHPHRRFTLIPGADPSNSSDDEIVAAALIRTAIADLAGRPVDTLSGGQRQRAWIAMALAQQTPVLLLDEPTSYLDIAHQLEVLDLLIDLRDTGTTVVAVLHDLNQAAQYADTVVAMKAGAVVATGPPAAILTADLVETVFGVRSRVVPDPDTGAPLVLARGRHPTTTSAAHDPDPCPEPVLSSRA